MRHYCAKQRESDKRWDFTADFHDVPQPIGYCCAYREFDTTVVPILESEQAEYRATAHKHHTDGHATVEEACECYKQYLLDHRLRLGATMSNQMQRCRVCEKWTDRFAIVGDSCLYVLCSEHNNRETIDSLYEAPTELWVS
jgi:Fe-S-cluster containining protein